ncbi:AAA family ATPase [Limibaculum sp. M0105]|uniref:AAA family ATPase n=1 Tax=Thermohalobaculum xanthum TaxID=2753746 RepID=A0A8J7M6Q2_9RHOB|nr:AAA family ATPase [Thermohalobaculum xanthum]MBK0399596.1 AAA family ATPase [Thermohalobaculum xanthum]
MTATASPLAAQGADADAFLLDGALPPQAPRPPAAPNSIDDTGLDPNFLVDHLCKVIYRHALERPSDLARALCLPVKVVDDLIAIARERKLIEPLGQLGARMTAEMRYALTGKGREWALEALAQSEYAGPAPVPMIAFAAQVATQSIRGETLLRPALERVFSRLTLAPALVSKLGPAANSGASMLLYGPPGNGKSSIAEAITRAFGNTVWLPHAVEVDRQIITVFDPAVHAVVEEESATEGLRRRAEADARYVRCLRPRIVAGGELTLDMLDLSYSPVSRVYEAPMQMKAAGGVLLIDDFGRQRQHPQELINRLIIPLENGMDYLALQTGRKFEAPFDSLVIFSTNIAPSNLVDDAALRRLRYKILVDSPDEETFVRIFLQTARRMGIALTEEILAFVMVELYARHGRTYQAFHPRFLIDQTLSICAFEGVAPQLRPDFLERAWENLFPRD